MQKIVEVPSRQVLFAAVVLDVQWSEQLFAHHGKDEDDNGEDEAEVAERAHRTTDDADEQIERRPRLGQLEHSQLQSNHAVMQFRLWTKIL